MAEADATPTRRISLAKGFARYAKIYGEATAKRDLYRLLGSGKVSWWGEKRGEGPLGVGDRRVWQRESAWDISHAEWADSRMVRRQGRPAPDHYQFVRIEIARDELLACMPEEVRARMQPRGLNRIGDLISAARKNLGGSPETTPQKKRRGPKKGEIDRYAESDRKHFPVIRELMGKGDTLNEAATSRGPELTGRGGVASRITRLAKRFSKENGGN
jgi:hypothetical protein